jgi:hypothetical protein
MLSVLEHFDLNCTGFRILDRSLDSRPDCERTIDLNFKSEGTWCIYCQSESCHHIHFAFTVPAIEEDVEKKRNQGWKLGVADA